jgi:DNA mismatch repair ATPase MutS
MMQAIARSARACDLRLLQCILVPASTVVSLQRPSPWAIVPVHRPVGWRGAKTTTRKKAADIELQQGAIIGEPLQEMEAEEPSWPAYPPVLQGVRENMAKFKDCIILTRVGNFYELYFDHAEEYGPLMNLKVAYRVSPRHPRVAMAGFQFHQLDRYLKMLVIDFNQHVAISEEIPNTVDGKVKSSGNLFDRQVARVVTRGTLIDENFMDVAQNNFLLAIHVSESSADATGESSEAGLAWIDLSTGEFLTAVTPRAHLPSSISRIAPREIVFSGELSDSAREEMDTLLSHHRDFATYHPMSSVFSSVAQWDDVFEVPLAAEVADKLLHPEKMAAHQLLDYARHRLQKTVIRLQPPRQRQESETLIIDRHSLRGLEILETSKDGLGKGSLFNAVKRTVTSSGERLLRQRLVSPSASLEEINSRLDLVTALLQTSDLRDDLVQRLQRTKNSDVQRTLQSFASNRGDADSMLSLMGAIIETSAVHELLQTESTSSDSHPAIGSVAQRFRLEQPMRLAEVIGNSIDEEGLMQLHRQEDEEKAETAAAAIEAVESQGADPAELLQKSIRMKARIAENRFIDADMLETWVMKRTASESIGQLHDALDALKDEKDQLQARLRIEIQAESLTLRWAPGKGYTCHIRSATAFDTTALQDARAHLISSTKTTRSYSVPEWAKLGSRIDNARLQIRIEEKRILADLTRQVLRSLVQLRGNADVMDELDVASAFAVLADEQEWTRPVLDLSTDHQIIGGRHPTVNLGLQEHGRTFIKNDCLLDAKEKIWLVTGPNMAGKSTFLRQNALITILAQVGSYVPADYARVGIVDQIFSRIGAADDLFRDQSTFMVEMLETAAILKEATPRSFAIMDEVGRGTTPQDGIAIAFGILCHLYEINKCRTLFATHFHRLADMTEAWKGVGRYCTDILEEASGSFIFQHQLKPGVNRNSHALKVAKLAGLPPAALTAAQATLEQLQEEDRMQQAAQFHEPTRAIASG